MRGKINIRLPIVGVDLMGGDTSPEVFLQAIIHFAREVKQSAEIVAFATPEVFESHKECHSFFKCIPVRDFILPDDEPLLALRRKSDASLCVGIKMLKKHEIDAFVSIGNTGALIGCAKMHLPTLSGIVRPALLTLLPTRKNEVAVLDVGANLHSKADHLVQFASMGIAYQKACGIASPTVGLLNIGSEKRKGTPELRETYLRLQTLNRNAGKNDAVFKGNIEGRDVFSGHIDVLVTDGFTGNVFLKTAEGISSFIMDQLLESAHDTFAEPIKMILQSLEKKLNYSEYPGAILCGIDGIVVKCHGDSAPHSLINGIRGALRLVENNFLEKIKTQLSTDIQKFSLGRFIKIRKPHLEY